MPSVATSKSCFSRTAKKTRNKVGATTQRCFTPLQMSKGSDVEPSKQVTLMLSGTCLPFIFPPCYSTGLPLSNTYLARELLDIFRFERLCRPRRGIPASRKSDLQEGPSYIKKSKLKEFTLVMILKCFLGKTKGNVKA